jgi:hypothetical protein
MHAEASAGFGASSPDRLAVPRRDCAGVRRRVDLPSAAPVTITWRPTFIHQMGGPPMACSAHPGQARPSRVVLRRARLGLAGSGIVERVST